MAYIVINDVHVFKSFNNQFRSQVIKLSREQILSTVIKIEVVISSSINEARKLAQVSKSFDMMLLKIIFNH